MGWAVDLPTIVQVEDLDSAYRPRSDDPSFFRNWTNTSETRVHWSDVASTWTRETPDEVLIAEDVKE
jgi:hypothetical protein